MQPRQREDTRRAPASPASIRTQGGREEEDGKEPAIRELINTGTNKLYVRHNKRGTSFKEIKDVGTATAPHGAADHVRGEV